MYCDHKTAGGGWTVFQKRQDGSVDFYRRWDAYKRGFGNVNGEFWLGLDKIHRLTVSGNTKLRVDLEDIHGNTAFAEYNSFAVASERAKYQLSLGNYSGAFEIFIDSPILLSIEIPSYDKVIKESNRISFLYTGSDEVKIGSVDKRFFSGKRKSMPIETNFFQLILEYILLIFFLEVVFIIHSKQF